MVLRSSRTYSHWSTLVFAYGRMLSLTVWLFWGWGPAVCTCHMYSSWEILEEFLFFFSPTVLFLLLFLVSNLKFSLCMHAKLLQSCFTLCNPVDYSPSVSSVHGVLQARILEWVAMPSSRGFPWSGVWTQVSDVSCVGRQVLYYQRHLENPRSWVVNLFMYTPTHSLL